MTAARSTRASATPRASAAASSASRASTYARVVWCRESLEHEGLARVDVPEVASNVADDAFANRDAKGLFGAF
jgi:hypothetical protein